jgi:hypothetical protein
LTVGEIVDINRLCVCQSSAVAQSFVDSHSKLVRNCFLLVHAVTKFIFAVIIFLFFFLFHFRFFFFFFRTFLFVTEVALYILIGVD